MEKFEAKVRQIEHSNEIMQQEFVRERENLVRLEITNLRNNDEFK